MTLRVERLSVVIRREAIDGRYEDGWQGFLAQLPAERVREDGAIASFALEDEQDVAAFVGALTEGGLDPLDFVVVDSLHGPRSPRPWLEFVPTMGVRRR